jgi:hypothetical protein
MRIKRPVRRADSFTTFKCRLQIWEPQPPGTLRACPGIALPLPFAGSYANVDIKSKLDYVNEKFQ